MSKSIELYQSRVSHLVIQHSCVSIHFPHAYIYKAKGLPGRDPGSGWSQEVEFILDEASIAPSFHHLPNMISDGYFEVDGERYEVVPVPLGEHERGHLHLEFDDGGTLDVTGSNPIIKLIGKAIPLEDFS